MIRAVVRVGIAELASRDGFVGLMAGSIIELGARDVGGIIQRPGTVLRSARAPDFATAAGQDRALRSLRHHRIDALVVVGGNGSQAGAQALVSQRFPVAGVASTIDNDVHGAEMAIGVDTALNVAIEAIDRIRATAASHHRAFLVGSDGPRMRLLRLDGRNRWRSTSRAGARIRDGSEQGGGGDP